MSADFMARHRAKAFLPLDRLAQAAMIPGGVNLIGALPSTSDIGGGVFVVFEHPALPEVPPEGEPPIVTNPGYDLVTIEIDGVTWYRREVQTINTERVRQPTLDLPADRVLITSTRIAQMADELKRYAR